MSVSGGSVESTLEEEKEKGEIHHQLDIHSKIAHRPPLPVVTDREKTCISKIHRNGK
jgi:hypothetical protein